VDSVWYLGASDETEINFTIVVINLRIRKVFGNHINNPKSAGKEIESRDLFHLGSDANCSIAYASILCVISGTYRTL
jgi:hypothetical protein